jgi:hypothetical protein
MTVNGQNHRPLSGHLPPSRRAVWFDTRTMYVDQTGDLAHHLLF